MKKNNPVFSIKVFKEIKHREIKRCVFQRSVLVETSFRHNNRATCLEQLSDYTRDYFKY